MAFIEDKDTALKNIDREDVLYLVSDKLLDDKDVVLEAVRQNGEALQYASERLRNDKTVCLEALKNNRNALLYVSDDFYKYMINLITEALLCESADSLMTSIEKLLNKNHAYIVSSIEDEGCHIGRFKSLEADVDGNWVISGYGIIQKLTEK